ncbi:MAG: transglutaminase-like domain-containing protein [Bacteroidales bacterium]|nr:transglutaminase-like domain-containing protein [Bacteroidales bacterium]MCF8404026.1 transglutaminase-like domain-containing protein [Bacteroidales bacterium]
MKNILLILIVLFVAGCGPREFEIPEKVTAILDLAGENRPELEKVIRHFKDKGDVIKEEAAYYLIGNMKEHGYAIFKLVDSTGQKIDFDVLDFEDYEKLLAGWDRLEEQKGIIHFELDTLLKDYETVTADYLIQNIELAVDEWNNNSWAQHLSFEQFCEYVLPYRSSNEPIEDWRSYFINELAWVKDSVKDETDPVEAACFVNDYIKSWFRFDPRYYEHPTDLGLKEILDNKMGRCEDMTNIAIYAMRALAIPVMSDFTPYWANTGNNHAWNAILDKNDSIIIFMGGEANPGEYHLGHKMAKVYRKSFAVQENSLPEKMEPWETAPPYLNKNSIYDVTPDYTETKRIKIELIKGIPDSTNFSYLCVFNSGDWKAIDYTRFYGTKASYSKVGLGVAYLPAFYYDEEIIPAGDAFILTDSGNVEYKIPDGSKRIEMNLFSTTQRLTKQTTDFISETEFVKGAEYILYYWNDKWVEVGRQKAANGPLRFMEVPSGAIYWLVEKGSREEERIFTIDKNGKQIWW